jgi:hypothetical protein
MNLIQIFFIEPYPADSEGPLCIDVFFGGGSMMVLKEKEAVEFQAFLQFNATDIVREWASRAVSCYWQNVNTSEVFQFAACPGKGWEEISLEQFLDFGGTL